MKGLILTILAVDLVGFIGGIVWYQVSLPWWRFWGGRHLMFLTATWPVCVTLMGSVVLRETTPPYPGVNLFRLGIALVCLPIAYGNLYFFYRALHEDTVNVAHHHGALAALNDVVTAAERPVITDHVVTLPVEVVERAREALRVATTTDVTEVS